jgi:anaerobic selenocysteine-containing dehydrogenase
MWGEDARDLLSPVSWEEAYDRIAGKQAAAWKREFERRSERAGRIAGLVGLAVIVGVALVILW